MAGDASRLNGLLLCCYKEMRLPLNSITGESLVRYCGIDISFYPNARVVGYVKFFMT